MDGHTMLEVIGDLATDPSARAALAEDPDGFLAQRGLEGLDARDLVDAVDHAAEALPPGVAVHLTGAHAPDPDLADGEGGEGVLQVLTHVAEAPVDPDALHDGDLGFGEGAAEADDHAFGRDLDPGGDQPPAAAADADGTDEEQDEPEDLDADELGFDLEPDDGATEEEQPDLGEAEEPDTESEEDPSHWSDHHQDHGSVDPGDLGDHLGDLPG